VDGRARPGHDDEVGEAARLWEQRAVSFAF
jgi:hypothetical protein